MARFLGVKSLPISDEKMKQDLMQFAAIEFDDATIDVRVSTAERTTVVAFESAYDVANSTYVDGRFRLGDWSRMTTRSRGARDEIVDAAHLSRLEYIFDHWSYGHSMILQGLNSEPESVQWQFDAFAKFHIEIRRRSVWEETETGGHEVTLKNDVENALRDEFEGERVAIETPEDGGTNLQVAYARRCIADGYQRGEFPLVPAVLEKGTIRAREDEGQVASTAINKSHDAWAAASAATIVYTDFGKCALMDQRILDAAHSGRKVRFRRLFQPDEAQAFLEGFDLRD